MIKLEYENANPCALVDELQLAGLLDTYKMSFPNSESTLYVQLNNVDKFELKDEEGNVTGYEYKERIEAIIDEGQETERKETQYVDFDYGKLVADIQAVVDAHDPTPLPEPDPNLSLEERIDRLELLTLQSEGVI